MRIGPTPTALTRTFFDVCKRLGLSCPMGRALYATNRVYNGGIHSPVHAEGGFDSPGVEKFLRSIRYATARRWLHHWNTGGSLKGLCWTVEARSRRRAEDRRRLLATYARIAENARTE